MALLTAYFRHVKNIFFKNGSEINPVISSSSAVKIFFALNRFSIAGEQT